MLKRNILNSLYKENMKYNLNNDIDNQLSEWVKELRLIELEKNK